MSDSDICTAFRMALSARFDGEPAPDGREPDPAHERECPACQAFRANLEPLHRNLRESSDTPLPATLRDRLTATALPATVAPAVPPPGPTPRPPLPREAGFVDRLLGLFQDRSFLVPAVGLLAVVLLVAIGVGRSPSPMTFTVKHLRQAALQAGVLTLEPKGEAALRTPAGRVLRVWGGPGRLVLDTFEDREVALRQETGRLCCHWESRTPVPFRVGFGPHATLELAGTIWRLDLDPSGGATLEVAEGKVRVVTPGRPVEIPALQRVRISAAGEVAPPQAFNPFVDPDLGIPPTQIWIGER